MTIEKQLAWLASQPVNRFNRFGLALMSECWGLVGQDAARASELPIGLKFCVTEVFDAMFTEDNSDEHF